MHQFIADDGTEFETREACSAYERRLRLVTEWAATLPEPTVVEGKSRAVDRRPMQREAALDFLTWMDEQVNVTAKQAAE